MKNWQRYKWFILMLFGFLWMSKPVHAVYEGIPVKSGDYPWFVQLGSGCGGVLIDPEWVLTARHCITFGSIGQTIYVHGNDATSQESTISRVIRYDAAQTGIDNDIGLVQIDPPITDVAVISIPDPDDVYYARHAYLAAVGQGNIDATYTVKEPADQPDQDDQNANHYVHWYDLIYTSADNSIHHNNRLTIHGDSLGYDSVTFLAGKSNASEIEISAPGGTCHGDSGGGLVYNKWVNAQKQPTVIGIISSRDYCKEMALRKLFEQDNDGNPKQHTLPNGVTIDLPQWYLDQTAQGLVGYTNYTNVGHYPFISFINCNIPTLNLSRVDKTTITGRITLEDSIATDDQFRQFGLTSVLLNNNDGDPMCMTAVDENGDFTITLSGEQKEEHVTLAISTTSHRMITYTDGTTGIHPVRGTSNDDSQLSFYLKEGMHHDLNDISVRSKPLHGSYQLIIQPTEVSEHLYSYQTFMPMLANR